MSGKIVGLVFRKRIGDSAMKAVLAYCAERADDHGRGVWVAKTTMAAATEMSRATTYRAVGDLVGAGLLVPVGKRRHPNGETIEYDLDLGKLAALPDATAAVEVAAPRRAPAPVQQLDASPVQQPDPSSGETPPVQQPDGKASSSETQTVLQPPLNRQKEGEGADAPSARGPELAAAFAAFNAAAKRQNWPKVQSLTDARKAALRARLKDAGGLDGWQAALAKAEASDFLCGRNPPVRGSPFFANFDFLVQASSFAKLIEGNYDNRPASLTPSPPTYRNGLQAGFAAAAREARVADGPDGDPVRPLLPARH